MKNEFEVKRPRLSSRDLRDSLVITLRQLCAKETSVTHVCNETGINRQQFAKYLDGRSVPSFENAMRIADYFDIACEELFGFRSVREFKGFEFPPIVDQNSWAFKAKQALEVIEQASENAEVPALGYYYCYLNVASDNPRFKHSFIKSLMRVERLGNEIVIERRQYLQKHLGITRRKVKYYGVGHVIQGMLSARYCGPNENEHLSSFLVRSHHYHGSDMAGILLGRCNTHGGEAGASAMFLEYLGGKPQLRTAIAACGLFPHGEGHAPKKIEEILATGFREDQFGFVVR